MTYDIVVFLDNYFFLLLAPFKKWAAEKLVGGLGALGDILFTLACRMTLELKIMLWHLKVLSHICS